jgi:predicted RNase H-like nuclease (RuvC/YqgF family)
MTMGAARFAHAVVASDPAVRLYIIDRTSYERQIDEIRTKSAAELDKVRRELTHEIVTLRRELIASHDAVEKLRSANSHLQSRLQAQDAALKTLQSTNADLERQLRACGNIRKFFDAVARGDER